MMLEGFVTSQFAREDVAKYDAQQEEKHPKKAEPKRQAGRARPWALPKELQPRKKGKAAGRLSKQK